MPTFSVNSASIDNLDVTGSLNISGTLNLSGSFIGTASYANLALSSSYAATASLLLGSVVSASYAATASIATSSSYALSASYAPGGGNAFPYIGDAQITGSLSISGSSNVLNIKGSGSTILSISGSQSSLFEISDASGSQLLTVSTGSIDVLAVTNTGVTITGSLALTGSNVIITSSNFQITNTSDVALQTDVFKTNIIHGGLLKSTEINSYTGFDLYLNPTGSNNNGGAGNVLIGNPPSTPAYKLNVSGSGNFMSNLTVTGSVIATSFTGSLLGTASFVTTASFATTSSYILNAVSSSYASSSTSASFATTSSFATTASFALNAGGGSGFPFSGSALITGSIILTSGSGFPSLLAGENLTAGDFVNIYSGGVRRATNNDTTKQAHGFVIDTVTSGNGVVVYYSGLNTAGTGLTTGARYFLGITGSETTTPPTTAGQLSQEVGVAISTTAILVNFGPAIIT